MNHPEQSQDITLTALPHPPVGTTWGTYSYAQMLENLKVAHENQQAVLASLIPADYVGRIPSLGNVYGNRGGQATLVMQQQSGVAVGAGHAYEKEHPNQHPKHPSLAEMLRAAGV